MKKQRTKGPHQGSWAQTRQAAISSPLEKDFDSDIDDSGKDTQQSVGHYNVEDDIIEGITDDDLDDFSDNEAIMEDIEDDDDDQTIPHRNFKPFKALAGLDQWRPDSSSMLNTYNHHKSKLENELEAIEKGGTYGDNVDNESISTASSLDDASLIIDSPLLSSNRSIKDDDGSSIGNDSTDNDSISIGKTSPRNNPPSSDSSKAPSFAHPGFSLYPQRQDTQPKSSQAPSFILNNTKHQRTNYKTQLPIIEGGLASMALNCINQELTTFREWQTSTNIEMAKRGSLSKICDGGGRLCRLVESWEERGLFFGWCVDLTREECDPKIKEPVQADDPYLCVFSTAYMDTPQHKVVEKLTKAPYLGIWPPWTNLPIVVDGKEVYVHIVTRFRIDDPF